MESNKNKWIGKIDFIFRKKTTIRFCVTVEIWAHAKKNSNPNPLTPICWQVKPIIALINYSLLLDSSFCILVLFRSKIY